MPVCKPGDTAIIIGPISSSTSNSIIDAFSQNVGKIVKVGANTTQRVLDLFPAAKGKYFSITLIGEGTLLTMDALKNVFMYTHHADMYEDTWLQPIRKSKLEDYKAWDTFLIKEKVRKL